MGSESLDFSERQKHLSALNVACPVKESGESLGGSLCGENRKGLVRSFGAK